MTCGDLPLLVVWNFPDYVSKNLVSKVSGSMGYFTRTPHGALLFFISNGKTISAADIQ